MVEQRIVELILVQLNDRIKVTHTEVNAANITTILRMAMEIVEATEVKGKAQKALVEKVVRQVIVEAPISDDKEKLLLDMCDQGVLGNTVDLVVAASKGNLNINAVTKVATGCCLSFF